MTDLIQQAEALEAQASLHETNAELTLCRAKNARAEAVKLREQAAREPLRLWVNYGAGMPAYAYTSESDARHNASMARARIAVPMVEVRPVRITDEHIFGAVNIWNDTYTNPDGFRAVMEYALSLAGVEVEK